MLPDDEHMESASEYLRSLARPSLDDEQLEAFLERLAKEPGREAVQAAFDHLLRVADLTPAQAHTLTKEEIVQRSVGLRRSLILYVRTQEYRAAELAAAEESDWRYLSGVLAALSMPPF